MPLWKTHLRSLEKSKTEGRRGKPGAGNETTRKQRRSGQEAVHPSARPPLRFPSFRLAVVLVIAVTASLTLTACGNSEFYMDLQRLVEQYEAEQEGQDGLSAGDKETRTANLVSFDMHYVPSGGPFTMGEDVESTTQEVTLTKNFWMGETEVTQGLWEDVWGTTWPGDPGDVPISDYGLGATYPAYYVNWYDAAAFCNLLTLADASIADTEQVYYSDAELTTAYTKANAASSAAVYVDWSKKGFRLPTEAEWEYAARYIDGTNWNGGDHVSGGPVYTDETDPDKIGDYAWYSGNNSGSPGDSTYGSKEVGQKTANALGLRDMSGNVYEWCYDWHAAYSGGSETDPSGPVSGSFRVYRGGYWYFSGDSLRCGFRYDINPSFRNFNIGFRPCRTAD